MASQHLAKELKSFRRSIRTGSLPGISDLSLPDDDLYVWRFRVNKSAFDQDLPQTKKLQGDLFYISVAYGHPEAIIMEARFPQDYPNSPFFLRVVSPRMVYLSGHVTTGGSICIEALTLSGSPSSWQPTFSLESILATVLHNMMNCETVTVRTPTGPGGRSGPLAVDLAKSHSVVMPYSLSEATSAFQRTLQNHGWNSAANAVARKRPRGHITNPPSSLASMYPIPGAPQMVVQPQRMMAPVPTPANPIQVPTLKTAALTSTGQSSRMAQDTTTKRIRKSSMRAKQLEVVDLTGAGSDEEDQDDPIILFFQEPNTAPKRPRQAEPPNEISLLHLTTPEKESPREASMEERLAAANAKPNLHLLPPPAHWEVTDELLEGHPMFVELELPPNHPNASQTATSAGSKHREKDLFCLQSNGLSIDQAHAALDAAGGDITVAISNLLSGQGSSDEAQIQEVMMNGVSRRSAEAALTLHSYDVAKALVFCAECYAKGMSPASIAPVGRRQRKQPVIVSSRADEAAKRAHLKEAEEVLKRFQSDNGISSDRVFRIERVQNLERWSDYQRCKARIARDSQGNVNEQRLFHGAERSVVATICSEGFDIRVSNPSGALGSGIYFAQTSRYSDSYARQPRRTQDSTNAYNAFAAFATPLPIPAPVPVLGGMQPMAMPQQFFAMPSAMGGNLQAAGMQIGAHMSRRQAYVQQMNAAMAPHRQHQIAAPQVVAKKHPSPNFLADGLTILLCDVALGNSAAGLPGMRRPPSGHQSTGGGGIWAVYDNSQSYPAYCIHYK